MAVLRMHGVGVAWSASAPIFEDVTVTLESGFYGLVGANGAGKTTLLELLAGTLEAHDGRVVRNPRDAVVAYCPQRVDSEGADVEAFGARDDAAAIELCGRFALDRAELRRWSTLSPGERKRWQVAAALGREPDVLLLDEPTNHLDAAARDSLLGGLRQFHGLGVVVSHDRALLDALTRNTLRVHARRVSLYPGAYSMARQLWQAERARREDEHAAARQQVRRTEAKLDSARRTQAAAARQTSVSARAKNRHDHDARGMLATNLASWADKRAGQVVGNVRREIERARELVPRVERDATLGRSVFAGYQRAPNPVLFHVDLDRLCAGEHVVLRDVRLSVGRAARLRIAGDNGAGKTSLLRALLGSLSRTDRVLYLPQELEAGQVAALGERLRGCDREARGRVLAIFAALGSDPEQIAGRADTAFSPGEARKLALAFALEQQVWALVLDEPTNHLDLPSVERLEAALSEYPGCVLLVTHDDAFAAKLTTTTLTVAGGVVS
jgi:ATPase subunit of ABC transporter with duplicated ATPase domains